MGFAHVESGPLVRSSYHAADSVGQDSSLARVFKNPLVRRNG